jgi:short-subunit dehydrogenase
MAAESALRKVFLTGASAGIGLETARLLTASGFEVWGTSRGVNRLPQLPAFHPVVMDLRQPSLPADVPFDVLISNAGAGVFGPLETLPAALVREQLQILFEAPLELIRQVLPGMRARGRGTIINVTSLAGVFPIPYMAAYSAGKAGLSALSESLRMELAVTPIRVVDIRPGDINTRFYDSIQRIEGAPDQARMARAWDTITRNMRNAPPPAIVARAILRVLQSENPPPAVTVGGAFQAKLAPFAARLAPPRLREWALRRYYRL